MQLGNAFIAEKNYIKFRRFFAKLRKQPAGCDNGFLFRVYPCFFTDVVKDFANHTGKNGFWDEKVDGFLQTSNVAQAAMPGFVFRFFFGLNQTLTECILMYYSFALFLLTFSASLFLIFLTNIGPETARNFKFHCMQFVNNQNI